MCLPLKLLDLFVMMDLLAIGASATHSVLGDSQLNKRIEVLGARGSAKMKMRMKREKERENKK